ncbi:MAG: hypothetical protein ACRCWQ_08560 [Bacilli bacterium]
MNNVVRNILIFVVVLLILSGVVGLVITGLKLLLPLALAGLVLYLLFRLFEKAQSAFSKNKRSHSRHSSKQKHTVYYEVDEFGNKKASDVDVTITTPDDEYK